MYWHQRRAVRPDNRQANEVLQKYGFSDDLLHEFSVRILELFWMIREPRAMCSGFATFPVSPWEQAGIFHFKFIPWNTVSKTDPSVLWVHLQPQWLVKIKK